MAVVGITYDLKSDWNGTGNDPVDINAEFDKPETLARIVTALEYGGHRVQKIGNVDSLLKQIDDLDAGDEGLDLGRLIDELGRVAVDRQEMLGVERTHFIDGFADDVEDSSEDLATDWRLDHGPRVLDRHAPLDAFGGVHRDGAHGALAEVLGHFEHEIVGLVIDPFIGQRQRGVDLWQVRGEDHVDDGAGDLGDFSMRSGHV